MPLDPERALQAALLARLRAEPSLTPLLGGRVYDDPPPDPVHPFVTIGRSHASPWGGGSGAEAEGTEHVLTLACVSRYGGAEEAKAVAGLLRDTLHEAAPTLADHRLVHLRVTYVDVFRSSDWRSTYGVVRLRAVTEPL